MRALEALGIHSTSFQYGGFSMCSEKQACGKRSSPPAAGLKTLSLNPIGSAGATALAAAIAAGRLPTQIKWLELSCCNISNEGAETLCGASRQSRRVHAVRQRGGRHSSRQVLSAALPAH